jgi:hypothetical protein
MPRDVDKDLLGNIDLIVTTTVNVDVCDKNHRRHSSPALWSATSATSTIKPVPPSSAKLKVERSKTAGSPQRARE